MAKLRRSSAKEAYWRDVFQRQAASGLSIRAFCQREELTESAFFSWRRTIRQRDADHTDRPAKSRGLPSAKWTDANSKQAAEDKHGASSRQAAQRTPVSKAPAFVPAVIHGEADHEALLALKLPSGLELRLPAAIPAVRVAELVRALESRAES